MNIRTVLDGIYSGYSFRGKVNHDPEGDVGVIQLKDLTDNYTSIKSSFSMIHSSIISSKYFLRKGDVLFIAKGSNNYAITFSLESPKMVATSAFFVLRPNHKIVPQYLTWYLNQSTVQQYIQENRAGTYIPNINKGTVEEIKIQLPSLEKQQLISQIADLSLKEQNVLLSLQERRKKLIETFLKESLDK